MPLSVVGASCGSKIDVEDSREIDRYDIDEKMSILDMLNLTTDSVETLIEVNQSANLNAHGLVRGRRMVYISMNHTIYTPRHLWCEWQTFVLARTVKPVP